MKNMNNSWKTFPLSKIINDYQTGFASGQKKVLNGVKHLRMNNISVNGDIDLTVTRTVPNNLLQDKYILKKDDVLICITNSAKLVGKCALFNFDQIFAYSNHLARLRVNSDQINSHYLHKYLWLYWKTVGYNEKCKHWVNQSSLPKNELLSIEIPVPPLEEQKRIIEKLDQLLPKVQECQGRLEKIPILLKRFRQSVLHAAFSGKLTEKWRQENSFSSLSLLKQIRSQRSNAYIKETSILKNTIKTKRKKPRIESENIFFEKEIQ